MGRDAINRVCTGEMREMREMRETMRINNAPCPMPNAPCPMPNAQCPMPNAHAQSEVIRLQHLSGTSGGKIASHLLI
ncbi:MAG: hypothetical protein V7L05_25185 [Nostoc sp.]|uniref:hypothetical protein n=1 Tax=Nostoc sp. TaxID=1180 RepID=UPI002FF695EA